MKALVYDPSTVRWIACKVLGSVSPAVFWSRLASLRYRDVPAPELPNARWVRLRTLLGGICGTDLSLILQKDHPASYLAGLSSFPIILGHENVAVIDQVGADVTDWQIGERVCVEPALSCAAREIEPACSSCASGRFSTCEHVIRGGLPAGTMIGLNAFTGGSWAPYFVAHHSQLHRVPDELPNEQAVITDAFACALHGVLRKTPADHQTVLVHGSGIIALGVVAGLRALDCKAHVTAVARHPYQMHWLWRMGADEVVRFSRNQSTASRYDELARRVDGSRVDGRFGNHGLLGGFDVVYDCVGTGRSLTDSFKFTRARGTTVLLGTSNITLTDTTPIWHKEIDVLGAYGRQIERHGDEPQHTYEAVFKLCREGKLFLDGLLTHTYPASAYADAFRAHVKRSRWGVVKAAFQFD